MIPADEATVLTCWRAAIDLAIAANRHADLYEIAANLRATPFRAHNATACELLERIDAALMASRPAYTFAVGDSVQPASEYDDPAPGVVVLLNGSAVKVKFGDQEWRTTTAHLVPFGTRPWVRGEGQDGDEQPARDLADEAACAADAEHDRRRDDALTDHPDYDTREEREMDRSAS